jgi:hypothetical protein
MLQVSAVHGLPSLHCWLLEQQPGTGECTQLCVAVLHVSAVHALASRH